MSAGNVACHLDAHFYRTCLALAALLFVRLHQCEWRPAAFRQRLGRASSRRSLVQGLSRDRGRDRRREGSRAGFRAIANRTSTTALSLKVFMKTSHHRMPNLIITPDQADDLTNYILSLKRD